MLRDSAGLNQKDLARKIDVQPNTMNQYERGRRRMSEEVILKIAEAVKRDPIEVWDLAYRIFRFNYFRARAELEDVDLEELISSQETPASSPEILKLFDSLAADARQLFAAILPAARRDSSSPGLARVVVQSPERDRKPERRKHRKKDSRSAPAIRRFPRQGT